MKASEVAGLIGGQLAVRGDMEKPVTGVYVSDLLSDVMAHAREGNLWLTIQTHQNVAAVALLTGLSAIVFTGGARPEEQTLAKAQLERINLICTDLPSYETAGILYTAGLRGDVRS